MPIPQTFYLNAPSLESATAVFYDAALTVCADDGFFSDGLITREQVGCSLLPQQDCPFCGTSCSPLGQIDTDKNVYLYRISADTGTNPTDVGAIIIEFNPYDVPNGIRATLNTNVYNELSSSTYGYLASSDPTTPTYVGNTSDNCGVYGSNTPITLQISEYDGVGWVPSAATEVFNLDAAYTVLTATSPQKCIMVVPKLNNSFNTLVVDIVTACNEGSEPSGSQASVTINCPTLLRSFTGSTQDDDDFQRCLLPTNVTYYVAPVNGVNPFIGLYDWVFTDAYGENKLANGKYKTNFLPLPNDTIEVQDGVVVSISQTC